MKEALTNHLIFLFRLSKEIEDSNKQRLKEGALQSLMTAIVMNGVTTMYQLREPGKFSHKDKKKIDTWKEVVLEGYNGLINEVDDIRFANTDPDKVNQYVLTSIKTHCEEIADKLIANASL